MAARVFLKITSRWRRATNAQNIVPYQFISGEEARRSGAKGGVAGVVCRRKCSLEEASDLVLSLQVQDKKELKELQKLSLLNDIAQQTAMIVGLTMTAKADRRKGGKRGKT